MVSRYHGMASFPFSFAVSSSSITSHTTTSSDASSSISRHLEGYETRAFTLPHFSAYESAVEMGGVRSAKVQVGKSRYYNYLLM